MGTLYEYIYTHIYIKTFLKQKLNNNYKERKKQQIHISKWIKNKTRETFTRKIIKK